MKRSIRPIVCAIALGASGAAGAVDLGNHGATFPIAEPDLRARMVLDARRGLEKHGPELIRSLDDSTKNHTAQLPPNQLSPVPETRTVFHDMSQTVARDIYVPVRQPDGRYVEQLMVRRGTKVNALDHVRPTTAMLFVDARDPEQLKLLNAVADYDQAGIQIVLTAGDPGALAKVRRSQIFYAQPWMLDAFHVEHAPAFLRAAVGEHRGSIELTYLARPFNASVVKRIWAPVLSSVSSQAIMDCKDPTQCGTSPVSSSRSQ